MNHPDFRVNGKIFATLWPSDDRGVVMLTREQQNAVTLSEPRMFAAVAGGWGAKGSTNVHLPAASEAAVRSVLIMAWRNKAPKNLSHDV